MKRVSIPLVACAVLAASQPGTAQTSQKTKKPATPPAAAGAESRPAKPDAKKKGAQKAPAAEEGKVRAPGGLKAPPLPLDLLKTKIRGGVGQDIVINKAVRALADFQARPAQRFKVNLNPVAGNVHLVLNGERIALHGAAPTRSELIQGEARKALDELDQARKAIEKAEDIPQALKDLDAAMKALMKARTELWKQVDDKTDKTEPRRRSPATKPRKDSK